MAALRDFGCGNCGKELPDKPQKRNVPARGGRRLEVCDHCALLIDRQTSLLRGVH